MSIISLVYMVCDDMLLNAYGMYSDVSHDNSTITTQFN